MKLKHSSLVIKALSPYNKNPMKIFSIKIQQICIAVIFTIWGLYLRAVCLYNRNWSVDEINQYNSTVGALKPFWLRIPNGELTLFPGDYLLTYPFVQIFKDNKWGASIPHILATILAFYFLYLICQRYLKTTFGMALAFLAYSQNNELIFHGFEYRSYPLLAALGLIVFYFTETIVCSQYKLTPFRKFLIGVLFFFTLLYHTYGLLIVGFCTMFSILKESRTTPWVTLIKRVFKFYIPLGIITFPFWYWYASYNIGQNVTHSPTFDFIPNPLINLNGFLKSIFGNLLSPRYLHFLFLGPLLAFILPSPSRLNYIGFFLTLIVLPITLLCSMDVSMIYWFLQRQFIWVISLFSFFLAWGWENVFMFLIHMKKTNHHACKSC